MRWLRIAAVSLFGVACLGYGIVAGRFELFPFNQSRAVFHALRVGVARPERVGPQLLPEQLTEEEQQQLEALGYLPSYAPAPKQSGVVLHRPELSAGGQVLYVSAHAPGAWLVGFDGEPVHTWAHDFSGACPEVELDSDEAWRVGFWRRARLLPDGELLAVFDYQALLRLDAHSGLLWARCDQYHHEVSIDAEGNIYALRRERRRDPRVHEEFSFLDDWIDVLGPDGTRLHSVSVAEALLDSPYASHFARVTEGWLRANGDILHTNAIQLLDGRHAAANPAFRAGNVLIALRYFDLAAVIDFEAKRAVWAISGMWRKPHDPTLLDNGNLLIFDNLGRSGRSQVLEIEPTTQQIVWSYPGERSSNLLTKCCGAAQRLANGNTLITVSESGRVLEVTPAGEVAWEFVNPHRIGDQIAALWDAFVVDPLMVRSLPRQ
jgi:hypothetical protein